eukprot:TRINITY_DN10251_c0_g1_i2.p1 TRINITY_DN10251_c0_g1~~TRINITY_DN10251_c0_g1_i2.p1  ORF type:complete len:438 (-),score=61.82 TRINITY_DN10251_c0_g1_i2:354-1667(-)
MGLGFAIVCCILLGTAQIWLCCADPIDTFPIYRGTVRIGRAVPLQTNCLVALSVNLKSTIQTGTLQFTWDGDRSPLCSVTLFVADTVSYTLVTLDHWNGPAYTHKIQYKAGELGTVQSQGIFIFELIGGVAEELISAYELYQLMSANYDPEYVTSYLSKNAAWTFEPRDGGQVTLNESVIESGDYIGQFELDFGGLIIAMGTGSHTDHAATTLWIDNELFVVESMDRGIRRRPWADWCRNMNPNRGVYIAKLSPEMRARFNVTAAYEFFLSVEGNPYGWQNYFYGWVDTPEGNFPTPLSPQSVPVLISLLEQFDPAEANLAFLPGLNKRLGTVNLTIVEILHTIQQRNITWDQLITMPELDSYRYYFNTTHGEEPLPAMVCSVFVTAFYRAAGLFPGVEFQAAEFHPKDSYQVQIFDNAWQMPAECQSNGRPFCQVR